MAKQKNRRWRLVADIPIQGMLMLRLVVYWVVFHVAVYGSFALQSFLNGGADVEGKDMLLSAMAVSLLLLPCALFDLMYFSNQFVGPVVNLRRFLKEQLDDDAPRNLRFRRGDYFKDLEEPLTQLAAMKCGGNCSGVSDSTHSMHPENSNTYAETRVAEHV